MAEKKVKVGLVGFGTVGCGVARLILEEADSIAGKTGLKLELARVVDIDTKSPRPVKLPEGILTSDINKLLSDDTIEIGVELVGGTDAAKEIQLKMLEAPVAPAEYRLSQGYGPDWRQMKSGQCTASSTEPATTSSRI
jgi:homoserine dehydrogenase